MFIHTLEFKYKNYTSVVKAVNHPPLFKTVIYSWPMPLLTNKNFEYYSLIIKKFCRISGPKTPPSILPPSFYFIRHEMKEMRS